MTSSTPLTPIPLLALAGQQRGQFQQWRKQLLQNKTELCWDTVKYLTSPEMCQTTGCRPTGASILLRKSQLQLVGACKGTTLAKPADGQCLLWAGRACILQVICHVGVLFCLFSPGSGRGAGSPLKIHSPLPPREPCLQCGAKGGVGKSPMVLAGVPPV